MADQTIIPQIKYALASNDRPIVNDTSDGAFRRLFFVEFSNKFVDDWEYQKYKNPEKHRVYKKKNYAELFKGEKTAIFNLLLQSVHKLKESGWKLKKSQNTLDIEKEYRDSADPVGTFLAETYEVDDSDFPIPMEFSEIYEEYFQHHHSLNNGDTKYLTKKPSFGARIKNHFRIKPTITRRRENGRLVTKTNYNLKHKKYE